MSAEKEKSIAELEKRYERFEQPKKRLLAVLNQTLGNVSEACRIANVGRTSFYNYCKDDDDFKQSVEDIEEQCLDFAETALKKKIKDGDTTATIFYLKTKGKKRGYIEKQETELMGNLIVWQEEKTYET